MSYILGKAGNPLAIDERYYGIDVKKVQFTVFECSIGMIALSGGKMYALHLPFYAQEDFFSKNNIKEVVNFFKKFEKVDSAAIVGLTEYWEYNLGPIYNQITSCLQGATFFGGSEGIYGAINFDDLIIPFKAKVDEFGNLSGNLEYADGLEHDDDDFLE